jgi:sigma-B regulation protein RsbU (phosphoserine phosphatase)
MTPFRQNLVEFWRRLSVLDLIAMVVTAFGVAASIAGLSGGLYGLAKFLALCAGIYLLFRLISWGRNKLLWSLRNRLIVAYMFIAFVPVLLILTGAVLGSRILYSQFGAYLFYQDIQSRVETLRDMAEHIVAAHLVRSPGVTSEELEEVLKHQSEVVHDRDLPGLEITFSDDHALLHRISGPEMRPFAGLLQQGDALSLTSIRAIPQSKGTRVVTLRVPITPEFLAAIAPDLGAIQITPLEDYAGSGVSYTSKTTSGDKQYSLSSPITAKGRTLQPPMFWFDTSVSTTSRLDAVHLGRDGSREPLWPVLAGFNARTSYLNSRIFASVGELRATYLGELLLFAIAFFLIEATALFIGIVLTSRITTAVGDLYHATQFVQARDFSHRVKVEHSDQLGVLGDSFNQMTESINSLIEEQKRANRLQNELSIAREVQDQLFPHEVPRVPGVEIKAVCKAARMVSGDYYDFIQLSPTHIAIVIADISGKGISAALLMASLQAALRSQLLAPGSENVGTKDLVARLNLHLTRNTGDDRFATFFIAVYDSSRRQLRYTNAGHLPAFLISQGKSCRLDKGGMVLGVVEDYVYEQGVVDVPPGALVVGYSDGLVEPENVYGEEFGISRLEDAAVRVQSSEPAAVADSLMTAVEEWAGTPEQADDMTVIVARLR